MKKQPKNVRNFKLWGVAPRMVTAFILLVILPYICLAAVVFWFYQENAISSLKETTIDTVTAAASGIHAAMLERKDDSIAVYYNGCVELLGKKGDLTGQEKR